MKLTTTGPTGILSLRLPCLIVTLFLAAGGAAADFDAAVSHDAEKLNHSGVEHFKKERIPRGHPIIREALQVQPEFPEAIDNLG